MSFANLKRSANKKKDIRAIAEKAKAQGGKKNFNDDRFWKPTKDKAGNGFAIIRFLPAKNPEDDAWVSYWDHGFQGPTGQWYIEKSLTSIGQDDPVAEYNSELWKQGEGSEGQRQAREQKRRLHYVSNILVVSDPANPENDGKVFLYQYGKKIHNMILDAMAPEFDDEDPIDPFDFWSGANFKLKIRKVEGWPNYDKSEFERPSALSEDDSEIEAVYDKMYDIKEFTDPANYKSYDELKARLDKVLGLDNGPSEKQKASSGLDRQEKSSYEQDNDDNDDDGDYNSPVDNADGEDDDHMSYFQQLAEEDDE